MIRNDLGDFLHPASLDPIETDNWHHVAAVFAGESDGGDGTGIVYLDGVAGDPFDGGGDLQDAGGDDQRWYIGRTRTPTSGYAWMGLIDEVAIYPVALTEQQILNHIALAPQTGGGGVGPLQAGDANQDLKFDQLDLVQVQIAAKYLSGQAATWGDGDWNGAPGGTVGSPPAGDSRFDQKDIIAALAAGKYLTGPYLAVKPNGAANDGQTSVGYNALTGEVWVDAPAGKELTSINIESAGGIFTGSPAQNLGGSFDNDADTNIFKATFGSSFGTLTFGNVAQTGLLQDFVVNDLTVVGSLAGGGALGDVDLIYIPEPGTLSILLIGLGVLVAAVRRRRGP